MDQPFQPTAPVASPEMKILVLEYGARVVDRTAALRDSASVDAQTAACNAVENARVALLTAIATLESRPVTGLTVGAALADPRVQDGAHVVEDPFDGATNQFAWFIDEVWSLTPDGPVCREDRDLWQRWWGDDGSGWGEWEKVGKCLAGCLHMDARVIPLADADRDPPTREAGR